MSNIVGSTPLTTVIDGLIGPTLPSDLLASVNNINQIVNPGFGPTQTLFFDYFFSDNGGAPADNFNGFLQWNVTGGSVDLVGGFGPGVFGAPPEQPTGRYVDLGGSTGDPGQFTTRQAFPIVAGQTYNLTVDYRSTGGDLNSAFAVIGGQSFAVASEQQTFQRFSQTFTATETGVFNLTFQNAEGDTDNSGIGIDGVLFGLATGQAPAPFTGGRGADTFTGTAGSDLISGGAGADSLTGGSGSDTITAVPGSDERVLIFGGSQIADPNDAADRIIVTGAGGGSVFGNGGADTIVFSGQGSGFIHGGLGGDRIDVNNEAANIVYGGLNEIGTFDVITVTGDGRNVVFGGNQQADAADGNDFVVVTGNGNNTLFGNGGDDVIRVTGTGNNALFGGRGSDQLTGGSGADTLNGGLDFNLLTGGGGADRFVHTGGGHDFIADFSFSDGDRIDTGGQSYTLGQDAEGQAALFFADGGTLVLQGYTPEEFSAGFVA